MSVDQQIQGFNPARNDIDVAMATSGHPLQQAALRLAEYQGGRSRIRAKDLVGLLLCHGARAWRASQPLGHARIRVATPAGAAAVRIRLR